MFDDRDSIVDVGDGLDRLLSEVGALAGRGPAPAGHGPVGTEAGLAWDGARADQTDVKRSQVENQPSRRP
jgi:hypothetical protein